MECPAHSGEIISMACVTCTLELLCPSCVDTHIKGHTFKSLKTIAEKLRKVLEKKAEQFTEDVTQLRTSIRYVKEAQLELEAAEKCLEAADGETKTILEQQQYYMSSQSFGDVSFLQSLVDDKSKYVDECRSLLETGSDVDIAVKSKQLLAEARRFETLDNDTPRKGTADSKSIYTGRKDEKTKSISPVESQIQNVPVQSLTDMKCTPTESDTPCDQQGLSLVSMLENSGPASQFTAYISPCEPGRAWVKWFKEKMIKLINKDGKVEKILEFGNRIYGFRMKPNKNLLICGSQRKYIYEAQVGSEPIVVVKSPFLVMDIIPIDICPMSDGDFILSMVDSDDYNVNCLSRRFVVRYNTEGILKGTADCDHFGHRLFIRPARISLNSSNKVVAVVNYTNPKNSELVLLHCDSVGLRLVIKLRYVDHGEVVPAKQKYLGLLYNYKRFFVNDVCFDPSDNIIITEAYSRSIRLLSSECQQLKVLWTDTLIPVTVCVQSNWEVWCGFYKKENGIVKVFNWQ